MYGILTIVRYPKYVGFAGLLSMAVFRLPLWLDKKTGFWKLLGCGRNGTFDKSPDWRQWAILQVRSTKLEVRGEESATYDNFSERPSQIALIPSFISKYWRFFKCEVYTVILEPLEGHGLWDGRQVFGALPKNSAYNGPIAILTRATIKLSKLNSFWQNVDGVAAQMKNAPGLFFSVGIGEVPFIKQATFSVWQSREQMRQFAYNMQQHKDVIQKTRQQKWYSEEMFVRFKIIATHGTLKGINPL